MVKFEGDNDDPWNNLGVVQVAMRLVNLKSVPVETTNKYQKFSYESTSCHNFTEEHSKALETSLEAELQRTRKIAEEAHSKFNAKIVAFTDGDSIRVMMEEVFEWKLEPGAIFEVRDQLYNVRAATEFIMDDSSIQFPHGDYKTLGVVPGGQPLLVHEVAFYATDSTDRGATRMHFHCAIKYPSILQRGSFAWMVIGIVKDNIGDQTVTYVGNLRDHPHQYTIRTAARIPELNQNSYTRETSQSQPNHHQ